MSAQTVKPTSVSIEWDDGAVFIFSFTGAAGSQVFCGFPHVVLSLQSVTGSQTQVTTILQQIVQAGVQVTLDPQTWIETVKTAARSSQPQITIVYDDSLNMNYTNQIGAGFQLQQIYSLAG